MVLIIKIAIMTKREHKAGDCGMLVKAVLLMCVLLHLSVHLVKIQSYSLMIYALFHVYTYIFHKEILNTEYKRGKE